MPKSFNTFLALCALSAFLFTAYAGNGVSYQLDQPVEKSQSKIYKKVLVPGGEPIYVGGVKEVTLEQEAKIPYVNILQQSPPLPTEFNNKNKYLRPSVDQGPYGSCAQAGGIGFHYTYAINLLRDTDASDPSNQFNFFYTWNFLNGGSKDGGSSFLEGWEIANENGIPDSVTWGVISPNYAWTKWMSGYDQHLACMLNRYADVGKIDVSTFEGIDNLKYWIKDLGQGAPVGGIATFSINCLQPMWNASLEKIPTNSPYEAGKLIIPAFGAKGGHVMNIVGWHDSVWYDVNQDGKITNDSDITFDGIIDIRDKEMGAWLCVNSWNSTWGDGGFYYMMYRVGALEAGNAYADTNDTGNGKVVVDSMHMNNGGLTTRKKVYTLLGKSVDASIIQQFTYKVTLAHDQRDQISILAGVSNDITDSLPEVSQRFSMYNYQGGAYPMQGVNQTNPIEIGFDVKHLLNNVNQKQAKFFLMIDSKGAGTGQVNSFSLFDRRGASPVEATCTETNVAINAGRTILSIVYESDMNPLIVLTDSIPGGVKNASYSTTLEASGGTAPYVWELLENVYYEGTNSGTFPEITTVVTTDDPDDGIAEKALDFTFKYFGEDISKIYIGTDGIILFEPEFVYVRTPKALMATKAIAGLGCDLTFEAGDNIYCEADSSKATIRWQTKHMWSEAGSIVVDVDFAVTIYPSGKIEYFYKTLTGDISGMAMGASGGEGNSNFVYEYGTVAEIPASHKAALLPEVPVNGLWMATSGVYSGTVYNDNGDYRVTFAVTDALQVRKVKSYNFNVDDTNPITAGINIVRKTFRIMNTSNASIVFAFETDKNVNTRLDVFTLNGKKIHTMYNGKIGAGKHKLSWNYGDNGVSNGVYLFKLTVGKENLVKKVALFR